MHYLRKIIIAGFIILSSQFSFAGAGDPLASFGTNGLSDPSPINYKINKLIKLNNGKFIATAAYSGSNTSDKSGLVRFNADGSIDSSFGSNGVINGLGTTTDGFGTVDIAEQNDGKLILLGATEVGLRTQLIRVSSDGLLDTSFGNGGRVTVTMPNLTQSPKQMLLQSDGKIVVAGTIGDIIQGTSGTMALRFLSNGTLDTSFNNDGIFYNQHSINGHDGFNTVIQQTDGKLLFAGNTNSGITLSGTKILLYRLNLNGSIDSSFGSSGYVETDIPSTANDLARNIAINNGDIFIAAASTGALGSGNSVILRYSSTGVLDNSFGNNGVVTGLDFVTSIIGISIDSDQKLVLSSYNRPPNSSSDYFAYIQRFDSTGIADTSFNTSGTKLLNLDTDTYRVMNISPQGIILDGNNGYLGFTDVYGRSRIMGISMNNAPSNNAPIADAGGPYIINEDQNLQLDASNSQDADGDTLIYEWDIDNDGTFDNTITGSSPVLEPAIFRAFGLPTDGSSSTITLRVSDGEASSTSTASVTINNLTPIIIVSDFSIKVGQPATFNATDSTDVYDNITVGWDIDNDGNFNDGDQLTVLKTWNELEALGLDVGTHTVTVKITDGEGAIGTGSLILTIEAADNNVTPPSTGTGGGSVNLWLLIMLLGFSFIKSRK